MPTYARLPRFGADWDRLDAADRERFRRAVRQFIDDLNRGKGFRKGLRVKRVQGTDVYELTFAGDGRATWEYGRQQRDGEAHIVWRRIGSHAVLRDP